MEYISNMLSCDEDYSEEDERKRKQNIGNLRTSTPKKSRGAALSDDSPVLSEMSDASPSKSPLSQQVRQRTANKKFTLVEYVDTIEAYKKKYKKVYKRAYSLTKENGFVTR